jgi:hypothetical protein
MSDQQLVPVQTWLRLFRDWYTEPKLVRAADEVGTAAAAGYVVLLGRATSTAGLFPNLESVVDSIRADSIGIGKELAKGIADALIRSGLLSQVEDGYRITDWHLFRAPNNALPPKQRTPAPSQAQSRGGVMGGVTEGERDREKQKGEGGDPLKAPMHLEPIETVVLPPKRLATKGECSHGIAFHPKKIKDGVTIITADHQVNDGQWCRDKPA